MKYFTPELFVKLQEVNDKRALMSTHGDWDRAVAEYGAHLRELVPDASPGLRRLIEFGSLHDCHVLNMWQGRNRLTIILKPQLDAARLLVLTYSLVDPPQINPAALPEQFRSTHTLWLYDEIGIERETVFDVSTHVQIKSRTPGTADAGQQGCVSVFTHDIFLSNGWDIRLRFHQLNLTRPSPLLPHVREAPPQSQELIQPQSA